MYISYKIQPNENISLAAVYTGGLLVHNSGAIYPAVPINFTPLSPLFTAIPKSPIINSL